MSLTIKSLEGKMARRKNGLFFTLQNLSITHTPKAGADLQESSILLVSNGPGLAFQFIYYALMVKDLALQKFKCYIMKPAIP